jgi:hypothetical protein
VSACRYLLKGVMLARRNRVRPPTAATAYLGNLPIAWRRARRYQISPTMMRNDRSRTS